mgnify:FL=1
MKQLLTIAACIFFILKTEAQSVAINTDGSTAAASALLDVKSTGKGVLVPRMSKAQKNAIATPATGLLVFQDAPDSIGFYYYNGTAWLWLATANNLTGWATTGNAGTDTAVNFIGTTDNMPLRFKQNNGWVGQFDRANQSYFIGSGSGERITSGNFNTAFGDSALAKNSTAFAGSAFGAWALKENTTGIGNTAFGSQSLFSNTTGNNNIAIGPTSLANHKSGDNNIAIGSNAMNNDTTGVNNISIGAFSLFNSKNIQNNVAVGHFALFSYKTSSN